MHKIIMEDTNRISVTDGEQKIYNPWNMANKRIPDHTILQFLRQFGIKDKPKKWELFRQACVHSSYVDHLEEYAVKSEEPFIVAPRPEGCMMLCKSDNEQIEFVGDSLLGCMIAIYLHERYPNQDEGFLTRLRIRLVNNQQLGSMAQQIGFQPWIILSRSVEEVCNGRRNLRILGSMLEAWVGAMYLDIADEDPGHAFVRVKTWLTNVYETYVDFAAFISEDNNFKDQLLKFYQMNYHVFPRYKEVLVEGPIHDRMFTMGVLSPTGDEVIAVSTAKNKKVAEQEASRLALIHLGAIKESSLNV